MTCEDCDWYQPMSAEDGYCDRKGIIVDWNDECEDDDDVEDEEEISMFGDFTKAIEAKNKIEQFCKKDIVIEKLIDLIVDIRIEQQEMYDNYTTFFSIDSLNINEVESIIESLESKCYCTTVVDKKLIEQIYETGGSKLKKNSIKHWLLIFDMADDYEYNEKARLHYKTQPHWINYLETKSR